ncbi:MAG: prenyltransferase [Candidatus Kapaibacteriales bacterium]
MTNKFKIWVRATRPFSFTASSIPVIFSAVSAFVFHNGQIEWSLLPVVYFGALFFHIGANMVSDYFDYKFNIDRVGTLGGSGVIVEKLLPPKYVLYGGYVAFLIGFLLGLILVSVRGVEILIMGLVGLFIGLFYTFTRKGLKYIALGDIAVFVAFGPLLIAGSYFALTGTYPLNIILLSLPIGFLVVAILHANNTRDIHNDAYAKIKTIPMIMGIRFAKFMYYFLIFGAYALLILFVSLKIAEPWVLLAFLSFPIALRNSKEFSSISNGNLSVIAMMDIKTAQLHLLFGILFAIGLLLSKIL